MTAIHLVTTEDLRSITSRNMDELQGLPYLYIPIADSDVMRVWGIAREEGFRDSARLFPGALVAPHYAGETASRGDLLYHGAEQAAAFPPPP